MNLESIYTIQFQIARGGDWRDALYDGKLAVFDKISEAIDALDSHQYSNKYFYRIVCTSHLVVCTNHGR